MVWQQFRQFVGKMIAHNAVLLLGLSLTAIAPNAALASPMTVYLYGTSPEAQQMGQDYMVISVTPDQQVQGVFYQVNSEFACFEGEMKQGKLNLAVMDPFEQVAYDYQLDYTMGSQVAGNGDRLNVEFIPAGFHAINNLSELDHELLAQCSNPKKSASMI